MPGIAAPSQTGERVECFGNMLIVMGKVAGRQPDTWNQTPDVQT